ncbi:MAG: type II secretion system F family protein, partial [Planctomycetota bacterium]
MRIAGLPPSNPERISGLQTRPAIQLARRKGNASAASPTASWGSFSLATKKRVKKSDLVVAWSQLSIMIQSGDDLASALQMVAHQCKHSGLREVLLAIYRDVQEGTSLSAAMAKHPKVFDVSMVAVIDAGENSGKLVQVLERMTT